MMAAADMLGLRNHGEQCKTTRTQADSVDSILHNSDDLHSVMKFHRHEVLVADTARENDVPFLTSVSDDLHCCSTQDLDNLKSSTLEAISQ